MNPDTPLPPLYAVVDYRQDGRPRIVSEHTDPKIAAEVAELLRSAGANVSVELISSIVEARPR